MMRRGLYLSPASRRLKKRLAAVAFRRSCTRTSSTTPCWSPARQRQTRAPLILTQTRARTAEPHAVLAPRAPEIEQLAVDLQEDLVQVPGVARLRPSPTQPAGE